MIEISSGAFIGHCQDELLLTMLQAIRDDPLLRSHELGICGGVDLYCCGKGWIFDSTDGLELKHLMSLWPKFSGKAFYPVPSMTEGRDACDEFQNCMNCWSRETAYGQLRWELLEFCIQRLEDHIYEDKVS